MKHSGLMGLAVAFGLAASGLAAGATTSSNDLEKRVTAADGWVAYDVPMVAGTEGPCCYNVRDGAATKKGCDLDGHSWSFNTDSDGSTVGSDGALAVYLRVEHGRIERVRAVSASCPVQTADPVRWIEGVDSENSVKMLSSLLDRASDPDDHKLVALAHHANASATSALAARIDPSHARKEREQALFWLGQVRGAEGMNVVEHYATIDADPNFRSHAVFVMSLSKVSDAYAHIVTIAHKDPDEYVRSQALFWMAQMHDARAKNDILAALGSESSGKVREQAVFALSRLDGSASTDALIAVLKGNYPRPVKKQALFWLGQSDQPQAMAYFDEALNK